MFSAFFIDRPKFALVISIVIVIAGLLSLAGLPFAQFPEITPPVVQITTTYPGASAEVVEQTVTTPIEQRVNGVDDMIYMDSTSTNTGQMTINVTFRVGTDPDIAQVNVQNRVAIAEPQLPEEVRRQGVVTEKKSTNILMFINLFSPEATHDDLFLSSYGEIALRDALKRLPGVSDAQIFGSGVYGMRLWLNPDRMTSLSVTPGDVIGALREQNVQIAAGRVGQSPAPVDQQFTYALQAKGRLATVEEFENVIIRADTAGRVLRVRDVARVELGAQTYTNYSKLNGAPAASIGIYQQPGANALATADLVRATMAGLAERFPPDLEYAILYDTTRFVRISIQEVFESLLIAVALVVFITYLFLGDWRATIVPAVTIPVSLIGSLAILAALGFSINTITLFALVLAIGVVVDDAIVVIENTQRLMDEEGLAPREAAIKAMQQVTGPVIATTLVLFAVFVPVGFLPGISGQLYKQFAVTITGAVAISSLNALTLSPALCAALLRPERPAPWFLLRWFETGFRAVSNLYGVIVAGLLRRAVMVVIAFAGLIAATAVGQQNLPSAFLPQEDQGYFFLNAQLPDGAALPRTEATLARATEILRETPGIDHVVEIGGFSILSGSNASNNGFAVAILAPWEERTTPDLSIQGILDRVQPQLVALREANVFAFNPPPIQGLGTVGGFEYQLQDTAGRSPQELAAAMRGLVFASNQSPELSGVYSTYQADTPQIFIEIDRQKAKTLGVPLDEVFNALQAHLGSIYVNDFNKFGRVFQVYVQADQRFRTDPEDALRLYVRNEQGTMLPLSTLVRLRPIVGPETISRYNLFRAAKVNGNAAPGFSSGDAIAAMESVSAKTLPPGMAFEWSGVSLQEIEAGNLAPIILGLALLFVYLFLVAQYESWTIPVSVILTVPIAAFGAVAAQFAFGLANDIYGQIGLVMLVGLASKNTILIVEFAKQLHAQGKSALDAGLDAAKLRFRAVMMTGLSFVLGVTPLVLATGAGAASRVSLGAVVFGGMIAASLLGTLVAPSLYVVIQSTVDRIGSRKAAPAAAE
ncbi:MAG: multidrug efflux RND transporter permease subunit [Alphaproteobacteria bacterium]|nr:multidrug efflux RND transporter permease subunit [Alphaproteobacteria bacterium]